MKKVIKIEGMGCGHCVASVKEELSKLDGVKILDVEVGSATIDVPEDYDMKKIDAAIDEAGYEVVSVD